MQAPAQSQSSLPAVAGVRESEAVESEAAQSLHGGPRREFPPRLPVPMADRSRLHERLDAHLPLTVIRAPAGFGRTTLINSWLADRTGSVADAVVRVSARGEPGRFWDRLARELEMDGLDRAGAPAASAEAWAREVLLRLDRDVLVVVDDLDRLAPAIDEALFDLLRRSGRLRLILGLADPDRLAPGLRPGIDTDELTAVDLAFTSAEAWTFADGLHCGLSRELTDMVNTELGGWPAPTVAVLRALAAVPVGSRSTGTATRILHDHLAALLDNPALPQEPTAAALSLAVPSHLTAQIVAAMDDPETTKSFASLVSLGLVKGRDRGGEPQYHWPPAVRRLLAERMEKAHPERARVLHQRLWRHFRIHHIAEDELRHAAAAKDWAGVVAAVDRAWGLLYTAERTLLRSALLDVPPELLHSHPRVQATRALVLGLPDAQVRSTVHRQLQVGASGSHDDVETDLTLMVAARVRGLWPEARGLADRVATSTVAAQHRDPATALRLPVRMLQVGITRALAGDFGGSIAALQLAHRESASSDRPYVAADAAAKLACVTAVRGDLHAAAHWIADYHQQENAYGWVTPLIESPALVAQILIATASGRPTSAEDTVAALLAIQVPQEFWAFRAFALARFALATGSPLWGWQRLVEARAVSEQPEALIRSTAGGISRELMTSAEASALMALGRGNQARALLEAADDHAMLWAPRARLSLLGGDTTAALGWADRGLSDVVTPPAELTDLFAIRAIARLRAHDVTGANADLRQAVSLIRLNGTPAVLRAVPHDDVAILLADVANANDLLSSDPAGHATGIYPPSLELVNLTERELLLLQRLDTGDSLQAISTALFVSINTVKSQRRSLYQKLGAGSREAALARAREFGLLGRSEIHPAPGP